MMINYFIIAGILTLLTFLIRNRTVNKILSALFIVTQLAITIVAFKNEGLDDSEFFSFSPLGILLAIVLSILTVTTFYHSQLYLKRHDNTVRNESIYYAALMALIISMTAVYFSNHIGIMWAFIEATTLFVSVLIYHERTAIAIEATWKYLFICSLSIAIAFLGILFLSVVATDSGLSSLYFKDLIHISSSVDPTWIKIAFLLMFTGFCAKMGLFPLHTVCVDAHTTAPPPISAFISTTLMNVGFLSIYRIYSIIAQTEALPWAQNVLIISGVTSIAISAMQLLRVTHFKRMFAFSSLEHMGIVVLAIAAGGIGYYAAILHIILHSFAKASVFYQIGQVYSILKTYKISATGQYIKLNPIGALVVLVAFIMVTAIPPSGLFVSEFLIFKSMFVSHYYVPAILVLILITVIIFVFGRNFLRLLFYPYERAEEALPIAINHAETISQFTLFGLILFLAFSPPVFFVELIESATLIFK